MNKKFTGTVVILTMSLLSTWYVTSKVIIPNVHQRIAFMTATLSGENTPPYQYRLVEVYVGFGIQKILSTLIDSESWQHILAYSFMVWITFIGIFFSFSLLLKKMSFSKNATLIGLLLFQIVLPLSITGYWVEGDFIAVLAYLIGLCLVTYGQKKYIPLLIGITALNREQVVFFLLFLIIFMISENQIAPKDWMVVFFSVLTFCVSILIPRLIFGFRPNPYSTVLQIMHNTDIRAVILQILPLWLSEVVGFVILGIMSFSKSNLFLKFSFISLGLYFILFFFRGNLWELAKFLPAFIILIPISLQTITDEFVHFPKQSDTIMNLNKER